MHQCSRFLPQFFYFHVFFFIFFLIASPGYSQTVTIEGSQTTSRNLDTLYNAQGGTGDRTALVSSGATVDVPLNSGNGIHADNFGYWTLTNAGMIRGDQGVYLGLGGAVTNEGEITARQLNGSGIYLMNGGFVNRVTNTATGIITGGTSSSNGGYGISVLCGASTPGVVDNSGQIYAYGNGTNSLGSAVLVNGGGSVINRAGGIITGGYGGTTGIGVYIFGAGSVENYGQITGHNYQGVIISGGGTVTNRTGGVITANGATIGVNMSNATGNTVINETGATITGGRNGVVISGSGTVTNAGTITGVDAGYYGVRFSNTASGTYTANVTNSGSISGGAAGLSVNFSNASSVATNTFNNSGTITATNGYGLWIQGTGAFTNTINNEGTITGTTFGANINTGSMSNSGTIQGQTGISFTGSGADTLVNSGIINGSAGNAVLMGAGNDSVTLNTGSAITGLINGGTGTDGLTLSGNGTINITQITGFESIVKNGAGVWELTGTGSSGAPIQISAGTLTATGSIGDSITIDASGILNGTGAVGTVINSGRIAPGTSIGTLTINGNYNHQSGAVYVVEVNPSGQSDLIHATGTATISGGTVSVIAENGSYSPNTTYTILRADGGVTGTFADVTSNLAFLAPSLDYATNPYEIYLTLVRTNTEFASVALTRNQRAVASAIDQASFSATGDMQTVINEMITLTASEARLAFDQMGGAGYTSFTPVDLYRTGLFLRNLFGHNSYLLPASADLAARTRQAVIQMADAGGPVSDAGAAVSPAGVPPQKWGLWIKSYGATGTRSGEDIASRYSYGIGGALMGLDILTIPKLRAGVSVGYSQTRLEQTNLNDEGNATGYQAALYGAFKSGNWYADGALYYSHNQYEMKRVIGFADLYRRAEGNFNGYELAGYLEGGRKFILPKAFEITPMASLLAIRHQHESFMETGADSLNLYVDKETANSLQSALGFRLSRPFAATEIFTITPEFTVRWLHEFLDDQYLINARFAGDPAASFTVQSDTVKRDSAAITLGAMANIKSSLNFFLYYDVNLRESNPDHALTGGLLLYW